MQEKFSVIKFLVIYSVAGDYNIKYRLFSTESRARAFMDTLPIPTIPKLVLLREDSE